MIIFIRLLILSVSLFFFFNNYNVSIMTPFSSLFGLTSILYFFLLCFFLLHSFMSVNFYVNLIKNLLTTLFVETLARSKNSRNHAICDIEKSLLLD